MNEEQKKQIREIDKVLEEEAKVQRMEMEGKSPFDDDDYKWVSHTLQRIAKYKEEGKTYSIIKNEGAYAKIKEAMDEAKAEGRKWIPTKLWDELPDEY